MSRKWESNVFGLRKSKWLYSHQFARTSEKKNFFEVDVHHVYKVGIKRFWAQEAEMTLTLISSHESARKNFSWTRGTSCLESGNQTFLGSGGRNDSNTQSVRANQRVKNFLWTRRTSCLESENQTFLGSGGRNDSNTHQFARIGDKEHFMNSRYIMSRKWESNVFRLRRPKWL